MLFDTQVELRGFKPGDSCTGQVQEYNGWSNISKISFANWTARALRVSAFLWTLTAGAVLALATIRAEVINGLTTAGPMSMGRWYDMADLLIPYYAAFGGAFLALALLTAILWLVQRRIKKEPSSVSRVIA